MSEPTLAEMIVRWRSDASGDRRGYSLPTDRAIGYEECADDLARLPRESEGAGGRVELRFSALE